MTPKSAAPSDAQPQACNAAPAGCTAGFERPWRARSGAADSAKEGGARLGQRLVVNDA